MLKANRPNLNDIKVKFDGFVGTDTTFVSAKITKEIFHPLFTYDVSMGGRLVAYDHVVSAPPINAKERKFIPEVSFGVSYDAGPYTISLRDAFALPSIAADNSLYGVLSVAMSYEF